MYETTGLTRVRSSGNIEVFIFLTEGISLAKKFVLTNREENEVAESGVIGAEERQRLEANEDMDAFDLERESMSFLLE